MKKSYSDKLEEISKLPPTIQQIVLTAFVSNLFKERNIVLTIVGGAAVQFYTQAEYLTSDVDAILYGDTTEIIKEVMKEIGFKRTTIYRHFENDLFGFTFEFPPSPIEVGSRIITDVSRVETEEGSVRIVRIEDILMDRIIAAMEWKDQPSLEQAKLLWAKNKDLIDGHYLTDFAKKEGYWKTLKEVMGAASK
jgi:hypothetical protein